MASKKPQHTPEVQDVDETPDSPDVQDVPDHDDVHAPADPVEGGPTHLDPQGNPVTVPAVTAEWHENRGYTRI